jgi:hypothetical protein
MEEMTNNDSNENIPEDDNIFKGMREHYLNKLEEMGIDPDSEEAEKEILSEKGYVYKKELEKIPKEERIQEKELREKLSKDFNKFHDNQAEKEPKNKNIFKFFFNLISDFFRYNWVAGFVRYDVAFATVLVLISLIAYQLIPPSDTTNQNKEITIDSTDQQGLKEDSTKFAVVESDTSTSTTATARAEKVVIEEPEPTKDIAVIEKEPEDIDNELIAFYPTNEINFRSPDGTDKAEMIWKYTVEEVLKLNKNSPYEISFSISGGVNTLMNQEVYIKKENRFFTYVWEISRLKNGIQVKKISKEHEKNESRDYNDESYEIEVDNDLRKIITFDK